MTIPPLRCQSFEIHQGSATLWTLGWDGSFSFTLSRHGRLPAHQALPWWLTQQDKDAWSIASRSFALGWERCQWEEKLPSLIQRKFRQLPACQAPWHIPAQAVPAPPVCALGLQLRGKENHPPAQETGGSRRVRCVCILHFGVSF